MADVDINKFRASVVREGSKPASPGFIVSEGQSPTDPAGSGQNHLPVTIATAATGLSITESQVLGGAGTVGQYIRGDGSLADFPESSGGGSSVSYYLNGSVAQGTIGGVAYKELNKVPILGAGTDFTINADGYIASFLTDAGDPNLLEIPGGNWNFETYFSASSSGGTPSFYVELYKVNSGGTATLIASNSTFPELIAFGTNIISYFSTLAVPTTALALTDRLAIRYYVTHSGRTITLHTEDNHLCQIITTFTTGLTALNGLTAQIQNFATGTSGTDFAISSATATHTFNLPTASATNRGALSSADWSMFNAKQNALTNPVTGTGTNNTIVKFTSTGSTIGNSQILDNGTNVGINTITPLTILDIATNASNALGIGNATDTITNGDLIGAISFISRDASTASSGGVSNIRSYARSTYNTGGVSADLRFYVTNGLSNTSQSILFGTEAMRITEAGFVWINGGIPGFTGSQVNLQVPNGARISSLLILHNLSNLNNEVRISCTASSVLYVDGTLEATTIVKTGGTSSEFLKADGSVDSTTYVPTSRTITINGTSQDLSANRTYNVGTVTSITATAGTGISISGSPITSSGTLTITNTAPDQVVSLTASTGISISGTYPNFTITNTSPSSGGTVTSVTASSPLFSSGGNTPNITIQQASGSQSGFLSSTDWTTFNGKQNALTNPVTGTGASGQVAYFTGTSTITSESNLFWDATNDRLGIGITPSYPLHITSNIQDYTAAIINTNASDNAGLLIKAGVNTGNSALRIQKGNSTDLFIVDAGGNVLIGTNSNLGQKLQISGNLLNAVSGDTLVHRVTNPTTGYSYSYWTNGGGQLLYGIEGAIAAQLQTGSSSYDAVITTAAATGLSLGVGQVQAMRINSLGATNFTSSVTAGGSFISSMGNNTVIFSSSSATTGYQNISLANTTAQLNIGINNSTGSFLTNSTAYASFISTGLGSTNLQLGANNTIRMTVSGAGPVLFHKSNTSVDVMGFRIDADATYASIPNNESTYYVRDITNSTYRFRVSGAGTVFATNTTISSISDERLKENIRNLDKGLETILSLKPRVFDWKDGSGQKGKNIRGFIAQEVEQLLPELIDEWSSENLNQGEIAYKSVRMDVIPMLVKAIQELKQEIDTLKN
jgi:hypothetical protein